MWSSVVVEQSAVSLGATAQSLDCTVKHRQRYPVKMRRVTFVVLSTSRVARASVQGRALDDVVVCSCRGETTQSLVRQRSRLGQTLTASSVKRRRASFHVQSTSSGEVYWQLEPVQGRASWSVVVQQSAVSSGSDRIEIFVKQWTPSGDVYR
jgi:hypothetical protein